MARQEEQTPGDGVDTYPLLLECFLSEQMSLSQLHEHMDRDSAFREYVLAHITPQGPKLLWT